jgi:hypothetical protein
MYTGTAAIIRSNNKCEQEILSKNEVFPANEVLANPPYFIAISVTSHFTLLSTVHFKTGLDEA